MITAAVAGIAGFGGLRTLATVVSEEKLPPEEPPIAIRKYGPPNMTIVQLIQSNTLRRSYPYALTTLLRTAEKLTTIKINPEPEIISSFEDEKIFKHPFVYVNFADRPDWTFTPLEQDNLKKYLDRGGFIFVDAGINAEFLRGNVKHGQHHSFGEWEACPPLREAFATIYPEKSFEPLERSHAIYTSFYKGLPDPSILPDTVRDFVTNEKWPQGTYSAVAMKVKGRIAVLATPIISMGWGKNQLGNWRTTIRFRIRESGPGLSEYLSTAAYDGARYETVREDGLKDVIYCQKTPPLPAWAHEPDGGWRVFRYYHSREISDYAHIFYTQLGINFIVYALTH